MPCITSQPGVSRQIRELEEELGIELFVRAGKRLTGLTEPGAHVLPIIERLLLESSNLKKAGQEFMAQQSGLLSIAATHSQARYALPPAVQEFRSQFPNVKLHLHQGSPKQVADMLMSGEVDVGIATEALNDYPELVALPCYRWTHSVIVPPGHRAAGRPADTGEPGAVCADHLRHRLHRPLAHRRGLHAARPGAQHRADGHGRRRDQDLCAAGHGRRHRGLHRL